MGTENNYVRLLHQVLNFHCVKLNNPPDGDGNSHFLNSRFNSRSKPVKLNNPPDGDGNIRHATTLNIQINFIMLN